jgi:hypothetical protein
MDEEYVPAMAMLAMDYCSRGMNGEALVWAKRAYSLADWNAMLAGLFAGILVRTGEAGRADTVMESLRAGQAFGAPVGLTAFHLVGGDLDQAADWLEKVLEQRCYLASVIHLLNGPLGKRLVSSSRWPKLAGTWPLIERIGLAAGPAGRTAPHAADSHEHVFDAITPPQRPS